MDAKVNISKVLRQQLTKTRSNLVLLSSVTDPYQPLEGKYNLTRHCLEALLEADFPITILTKSHLVTRDIDILSSFHHCEVGLTVTTLDDSVRRSFEPNASSIEERLETLKTLREANIQTYAFLGPIFPVLGEATLEDLAEKLKEVGVGKIIVDRLNIKAGNWASIREALTKHYPSALPVIRKALFQEDSYYFNLKRQLRSILEMKGLAYSFCY